MLTIALSTVRTRWTTFISTFLALVVGVGLIAATGRILAGTLEVPQRAPERYATAPLVISPLDRLRVGTMSQPLTDSRGLPPSLVAQVAALGPTVPDRIFYAQLTSGDADEVGRPWSAASFASYRLVAGHKPAADNEIVVPADAGVPLGHPVGVLTVNGARPYVVVGETTTVPFEDALFFTDSEAARLSPRVDALVSMAPIARVRTVVGNAAQLRSGADLHALDPDLKRENEALVAANSLVGTAAGIAGFVTIFVVASAFAYAVGRRRRELALLRTAGATPGQIRCLVLMEATGVGTLASAVGCALGWWGAPPIAAWLAGQGFAPVWFVVPATSVPITIAFFAGVATAIAGAWSAARGAARIRPVEALRDASINLRPMSVMRWLTGISVGGGAVAMLVLPIIATPSEALNRKHYLPMVMLLLVAVALLAPALVPPMVRAAGRPLARLRGATGQLVSQGALTAARRTAATAVPVLLTVGLTACLLGTTATVSRARIDEQRRQIASDYVVVPTGSPGLNREVVDRIRAIPGAEVAAIYSTVVYDIEDGDALIRHPAQAVDPATLHDMLRLPVISGSVRDLRDDSIVVDQEWHRSVGDNVQVWLADGTVTSLRVAAVLGSGAGGNGGYLTSSYAPSDGLAERILVSVRPGVDAGAVASALAAATAGLGAGALTSASWAAANTAGQSRASATGMRVVLGIALLYSLLSVAGTMLMAAQDRTRELAMLRLAGATPAQVLRTVAAEVLFVVALGSTLAAGAAALVLGGLWLALARLVGATPIVVTWSPVGAVAAACACIALVASIAPVVIAERRRAADARR